MIVGFNIATESPIESRGDLQRELELTCRHILRIVTFPIGGTEVFANDKLNNLDTILHIIDTLHKMAAKVVEKAAEVMIPEEAKYPSTRKAPSTNYKPDPINTMKALEWVGKREMKITTRPRPLVTDPGDVVIKTTTTTVCG
jgi:hypothetical protein